MSTDIFFIPLQKQKQIVDLWNWINEENDRSVNRSVNGSIIQDVINEIPFDGGLDFQCLKTTIENFNKILTTGFECKYSDLGDLFTSIIGSTIIDLNDEILSNKILSDKIITTDTILKKITNFFITPILPFSNNKRQSLTDHCAKISMKFVVYATLTRRLAHFYTNHWEVGSASLVAEGIGMLSQIPIFNANMDMILDCIFDPC
ncbi:MAG: hypothetical protein LBP59_11840 [Planctomycetaceae bacterium]|jgi:hypothetical protein|nr:hypothetical protein [Planctomycetaceae bacterium]